MSLTAITIHLGSLTNPRTCSHMYVSSQAWISYRIDLLLVMNFPWLLHYFLSISCLHVLEARSMESFIWVLYPESLAPIISPRRDGPTSIRLTQMSHRSLEPVGDYNSSRVKHSQNIRIGWQPLELNLGRPCFSTQSESIDPWRHSSLHDQRLRD